MGNRKALIVGIDDYLAVPLCGCVNDAEDVAALLSRNDDRSINFSVQLKTSKTYKINKSTLKNG